MRHLDSVLLLAGLGLLAAAQGGSSFQFCETYSAACSAALANFNCSHVRTNACGNPVDGAPATIDNFVGTCECLLPYYFNTPTGRLEEEIWDAIVKQSIGSLLRCKLSVFPACLYCIL